MPTKKKDLASAYTGVEVIRDLKAVRKRPGMYIGSTRSLDGKNPQGLIHIAQEILSNAIDEAYAGYGKEIQMIVHKDNSLTVIDHGRGLPTGGKTFKSAINTFTKLHSSAKFDDDSYANALGTNGVGATATNAVSKYLDVEAVTSLKEHYHLRFNQDKLEIKDMLPYDDSMSTGTKITFLPDDTIFDVTEWDDNPLINMMEQSAFLTPGIKFIFMDERKPAADDDEEHDCLYREWFSEKGMADYVSYLSESEELLKGLKSPISFEDTYHINEGKIDEDVHVQGALIYTAAVGNSTYSFVNGGVTIDGGTHVEGAYAAISRGFRDYLDDHRKEMKIKSNQTIDAQDTREGLILALLVKLPESLMQFDSQSKTHLVTPEAKKAVQEIVYNQLMAWLSDHPAAAKSIIENMVDSKRLRDEAAKNRKAMRKARKTKSMAAVSPKLKPASSKDPKKKSLFITEGLSASSLLNVVRDKRYQAVFPIQGKILNTQKAKLAAAMGNEEISTISSVIGAGIGPSFEEKEMDYDKIIMACFPADTKVMLLDGTTPTIKEMADSDQDEFDVYSTTTEGTMTPGKAHYVRKIADAKRLIKLTLDDGQVIRSTPDHFFMNRVGEMVMAKDLTVGTSLMPLYFKRNHNKYWNDNRLMFKDNATGEYRLVHHRVMETMRDDYIDTPGRRPRGYQIHHINENYLDNRPKNLKLMKTLDHLRLHGSELGKRTGPHSYLVKHYNGSEEQKKMLKHYLHDTDRYDHATWTYTYNRMQKHRDDVSRAWAERHYEMNRERIRDYNRSEKHRRRTAEVNADPKMQWQIRRNRVVKSIKFMLLNHIPLDEEHWIKYKKINAAPWNDITDYFASFDELVAYVRANFEQISLKNYRAQFKAKTSRYYDQRQDIRKGLQYNHKIVKIEYEDYDDPVPVYCMEVDKYHNFAITENGKSGIFVKNCDSDDDGDHIASLLITLFYRFFPGLIEHGHLYRVISPLYMTVLKSKSGEEKYELAYSEGEHADYVKRVEADKQNGYKQVGQEERFKGLGSLTSPLTKRFLADPRYRKLVQITITPEEEQDVKHLMGIWMGKSAELRKEQIHKTVDFDDVRID